MSDIASICTDDYRDEPYWWNDAPRPPLTNCELPKQVDVTIIGSGYTGLNAALQTARAGRSTLVLESQQLGYGCSSRNGGQFGTSVKPSFERLKRQHGRDNAIGMLREGHRALQYLVDLIQSEQLDCDFSHCGRYISAHSMKAYEGLGKAYGSLPKEIEVEHHLVPRTEQRSEIGSNHFFGGCILPAHGSVHPGKYHLALLERVASGGAAIVDQCAATAIEPDGNQFIVRTEKGDVKAKDVVVATNGYTQKGFSWHSKRIVPIGSFQIATEPLDPETAAELIPNKRVLSDTQLIGNYFRLSPDSKRLLFGGRVTFVEAHSDSGVKTLRKQMLRTYPQLRDTRVAYSWVGYIAYTMDIVPHLGRHQGIYYSMGYCGSGISLSSYFGMRVGQKVLGNAEGKTELDRLEFRPVPAIVRNRFSLAAATSLLRVAERFM